MNCFIYDKVTIYSVGIIISLISLNGHFCGNMNQSSWILKCVHFNISWNSYSS